jgi:hypothetical protein
LRPPNDSTFSRKPHKPNVSNLYQPHARLGGCNVLLAAVCYKGSHGPFIDSPTSVVSGSVTAPIKVTSTTFAGGKQQFWAARKVPGPRRTRFPFCIRVAPELHREKYGTFFAATSTNGIRKITSVVA